MRRALVLLILLLVIPASARAVPIVGLADINRLIVFDSATPGVISNSGDITGLPSGERIIALDFRPATGQLYGLSASSRLYIINPQTRVATRVVGNGTANAPTLNGPAVGSGFDPTLDRLRVVSDETAARQNFLFNPDVSLGGNASAETPAQFATGDANSFSTLSLYGLAYTNNFAGATVTQLYGIHRSNALKVPFLVSIAPANGGQAHTIGALIGTDTGAQVTQDIGFDIAPLSGIGYVSMKTNSVNITRTQFYTINLITGAATLVGDIGGQPGIVTDIAVMPPSSMLYAVNNANELLKFSSANPETIDSRAPITGLLAGEQIYELDFRPTNGQLYGLGRTTAGGTPQSSHIYIINTTNGATTPVPASVNFSIPALVGDAGFDFSPLPSDSARALRIVTESDQNLAVDPDGNLSTRVDTSLAYATNDTRAGRDPHIVASAFSDNYAGATMTTLYDIDRDFAGSGTWLVRQGSTGGVLVSPVRGQLFTQMSVGVGLPVDEVGFDIAHGSDGTAYLTTNSMDDGFSRLSTFNVKRGNASTEVGAVGASPVEHLRDIAVAPSGTFQFSADTFNVVEDNAAAHITVTRTGDTSNEASVDYATSDTGGINPASSRSDYESTSGTLLFAAGQTTASFDVLINEDFYDEKLAGQGGEIALLTLSNPTSNFNLGAQRTAMLFIQDDEDAGAPASNPLDDTVTFVRQQYHDFLNREPDAAGLAFWTNNIESCGADAQCREVKRIDTSAAFFLSIEFQETGYTAYLTHQAANGFFQIYPFPITLSEFLSDTQQIGRGVVIGQPGAAELLEANKRAYFDRFVSTPNFVSKNLLLTPSEYVSALNRNAESPLTQSERDALVAGLTSGTETRATVLRKIVENDNFKRAQFNRAFVLSEYFGYLRRNPYDPPDDNNISGYLFWLSKLNQFNGDYRRAEMVKAFIASSEYRKRFGN